MRNHPVSTSARLPWLIVCCSLACVSVLISKAVEYRLLDTRGWIWNADRWSLHPWTAWSATFIGLSPMHTLANFLAMLALGVLGNALDVKRSDVIALFLAWPLTTVGLLCWHQVNWYAGLSGTIHAGATILVWRTLVSRNSPIIGSILGGGVLLKLLVEQSWTTPVGFDIQWGFNIVYAAHLSGAVVGLSLAAIVQAIMSTFEKFRPSH